MAAAEDGEPLSPAARLFHAPLFNCCIISVIGFKTKIDPDVVMEGLKQSLIKHPRFSSRLETDKKRRGKQRWVKTEVNLEDHIFVPDIESELESPDEFLEDYVSNLTTIPLNTSRPLWELHILNTRTTEAEAVVVLKIHHSVGDGMSLMSIVLACSRKTSNPDELPSLPVQKRASGSGDPRKGRFWWVVLGIWTVLRLVLNTFVDVLVFTATILFLKDSETPVKGGAVVGNGERKLVHRTVELDDIKLVKNAMNAVTKTINDVVLGVTQAGLSTYLNRKYGEIKKKEASEISSNLPRKLRLRAAILVNLRPVSGIQALADMMEKGSSCRWGNWIGYIVLPFTIFSPDNPLEHVSIAKATIDRRKLSLGAVFSFTAGKFALQTFGVQAAAKIVHKAILNTTMSFSNMVGPTEEISFYGHPMTYIAPSVYGHPHALTVHFQSYMNKMTISLTVDPKVIPDPHRLCDDVVESLKNIKSAVIERDLIKEAS